MNVCEVQPCLGDTSKAWVSTPQETPVLEILRASNLIYNLDTLGKYSKIQVSIEPTQRFNVVCLNVQGRQPPPQSFRDLLRNLPVGQQQSVMYGPRGADVDVVLPRRIYSRKSLKPVAPQCYFPRTNELWQPTDESCSV